MRLKKIVCIITLTAVFFMLSAVIVFAESQYVDEDEFYSSEDGKTIYISSDNFLYNFSGEIPGVTVCGYTGKLTDLVIPNEINGRAVSAIDENMLAGDVKITSVSIPSCITSVGSGAFNGCEKLESVTLSGSTQTLENVFCDCPKLKSISFPYGISEINNSFKNCTALKSVKFSRSVSKLGDGSFNGCSAIEEINWSTGLSYLGDVFDGCKMLTTIHVPKGIVIIDGAFDNCTFAEILELPDSLLYINSGFNGCTALRNMNIPDGLLYIGNAFKGCNSLNDIHLPAETQVDEYAFADCPDVSIRQSSNIFQSVVIIIVAVLFVACLSYTLWKSMKKQKTA